MAMLLTGTSCLAAAVVVLSSLTAWLLCARERHLIQLSDHARGWGLRGYSLMLYVHMSERRIGHRHAMDC